MVYIAYCLHTHTHTHAHTQNRILFSHQKEWNNAICSNMNGSGDYHARWNKLEKDKYCMILLKAKRWCKWIYLQNRNRLIDIENKFMVTKMESGGDFKSLGLTYTHNI